MAKRREGILREIRNEAVHQLRGFPREFKRQLTGVGDEAARQIFGTPRRRRHGR